MTPELLAEIEEATKRVLAHAKADKVHGSLGTNILVLVAEIRRMDEALDQKDELLAKISVNWSSEREKWKAENARLRSDLEDIAYEATKRASAQFVVPTYDAFQWIQESIKDAVRSDVGVL